MPLARGLGMFKVPIDIPWSGKCNLKVVEDVVVPEASNSKFQKAQRGLQRNGFMKNLRSKYK